MPDPILNISFTTRPEVITALQTKGTRIVQVLTVQLNKLMFMLQSYIAGQKLSGQVLKVQTGVLRASVRAIPATLEGTNILAGVESSGGPSWYGKIHEYGGSHAYSIVAVKARALRFVMGGRVVFAKRVLHPAIAARPFMRPSLEENADQIRAELNAAINGVINE